MSLKIIRIENTPVNSNCYLVFDKEAGNDCLIVDPGKEFPGEVEDYVGNEGLHPRLVILTHEHFDHISGCNFLIDKYNPLILCSHNCGIAIEDPKKNLSLFRDQKGFSVAGKKIFIENIHSLFKWGQYDIQFLLTPGHTDCGISFHIDNHLFTGDTLIKDIKTVTKLYTGSRSDLQKSIDKINKLKSRGMIVYPGHGDSFELDSYDMNKTLH